MSDVHPWAAQRHDMGSVCGDSSCSSSSKHSLHPSCKSPACGSPAADGWDSRGSSPGPLDLQVDVHDWNPSTGHSTSGASCCCWDSQPTPTPSQHYQQSYCQQQHQQCSTMSLPPPALTTVMASTLQTSSSVLTPSTPTAVAFPCPTMLHQQQQPARSSKFKQLALQLPRMARSLPSDGSDFIHPADHCMDTCKSVPDDIPSTCSLSPTASEQTGCNSTKLYTMPLTVAITATGSADCDVDTAVAVTEGQSHGCKSIVLSVSSYLPKPMARNNWSLAQFCLMRPMYKGETSSVHHVSACVL